jgi:hypothetical protein
MITEFDLIYDDFAIELDALDGMISSVIASGTTATASRSRVAGANAATLLLAATFEEFVRQTVRALFNAKVKAAKDISEFPKKIAANVWRRSLEMLARTSFEDIQGKGRDVGDKLNAIQKFCIEKDIKADVSKALAHNENNMRPGQLNQLFNQIGVDNMCGRTCNNADLVKVLGCDSPGKAISALESRLEDFFRRRNDIAHAVQLNSSSGPTSLAADILLFRAFGRALANESQGIVTPPRRPRASAPATA